MVHLPDSAREVVLTDALRIQMIQSKEEAQASQFETKKKLKEQAEDNFREADQINTADDRHEEELRKIADQVTLPTQSGKDNLLVKH